MFERALFVLVLSPFSSSLTSTFSFSLSTCSLSCTTSTMSSPPRLKTTAPTHNEEYCPVAIYNPLTVICMFMSHCTLHFTCPIVSKKIIIARFGAKKRANKSSKEKSNTGTKLCTPNCARKKSLHRKTGGWRSFSVKQWSTWSYRTTSSSSSTKVGSGNHNVFTYFRKDRNCEVCKRTKHTYTAQETLVT